MFVSVVETTPPNHRRVARKGPWLTRRRVSSGNAPDLVGLHLLQNPEAVVPEPDAPSGSACRIALPVGDGTLIEAEAATIACRGQPKASKVTTQTNILDRS